MVSLVPEVSSRDTSDPYRVTFVGPEDGAVARTVFRVFERLFGANHFADLNRRAHLERRPGESIWSTYVRMSKLRFAVSGLDSEAVPTRGPVVFVANHPTGGPDAVVVGHLIDSRIRRDALVLIGHHYFVPGLNDSAIPLCLASPFGNSRPDAPRRCVAAFERVREHLRTGGAIAVFPCGANSFMHESGMLCDGQWKKSIFQLALDVRASIVPIFIGARMSRLRRLCMSVSTLLYHAAAAYEVRHIRGREVEVAFGKAVLPRELPEFDDARHLAHHMRHETYRLGGQADIAALPDAAP